MNETRGGGGASVLAAVAVLFAAPLAFVVLLFSTGFEGVLELVQEGGWAAWALLAVFAVATLAGALVMAGSTQRGLSPAAALLGFALVPVVTVLGVALERQQGLAAIAFADPADRVVIFAELTAELLSLQRVALGCVLAAVVMSGGAAVLTLFAGFTRVRLMSALGAGGLTLLAFLQLGYWTQVARSFHFVAMASPEDRGVLLARSLVELSTLHALALGLLGVAVLVAVVAVVVTRRDGTAGLVTGVSVLVLALALGGTDAWLHRIAFALPEGFAPLAVDGPTLAGTRPHFSQRLTVGADRAALQRALEALEPEPVSVEVTAETTPALLRATLAAVQLKGQALELVAQAAPVNDPAFASCDFCRALGPTERAAELEVQVRGEPCEACVDYDAAWPAGEDQDLRVSESVGARYEWTGDVPSLLRAVERARQNGKHLVLLVDAPEGEGAANAE